MARLEAERAAERRMEEERAERERRERLSRERREKEEADRQLAAQLEREKFLAEKQEALADELYKAVAHFNNNLAPTVRQITATGDKHRIAMMLGALEHDYVERLSRLSMFRRMILDRVAERYGEKAAVAIEELTLANERIKSLALQLHGQLFEALETAPALQGFSKVITRIFRGLEEFGAPPVDVEVEVRPEVVQNIITQFFDLGGAVPPDQIFAMALDWGATPEEVAAARETLGM